MVIKVSKIIENSIIILILFLVFLYDLLAAHLGFVDELAALVSFIVILYYILVKSKLTFYRKEYYIIILLSFTIIIGLASNYYTHIKGYDTNPIAIFADVITFSKAFVTYIAIRMLNLKFNSSKVIDKILKYSIYIFYILVLFVIVDMVFDIYPKAYRYGFNSLELFFQHGSRYAFVFSFIFIVLLSRYKQKNLNLILFVLFIGLLSLRVKYMGFLVLSLIFLFFGKRLIKIPKNYFLIGLAILVSSLTIIFQERIQMYFTFTGIHDAWSRAVVLKYSFDIGADFFPFGTGFGTFSSYYSGYYYSWVYDLYGISYVYGISRGYWNFVADQYWPMVLGQFGYFGLAAMLMVVYNYLTLFLTNLKVNINNPQYYAYLSLLLALMLLLIDSTSDAIFSQQRAVAMLAFFALIINSASQNESFTN